MDSLCSGYLMVYCIQASELSENVEGEEGPSNEWYELGNKCLGTHALDFKWNPPKLSGSQVVNHPT